MLERVRPVLDQLTTSIQLLEDRQATLLANLKTVRQSLTEAFFSPAQLFETRKGELDALVSRFSTAAPGEQAGMVERITALTQEVFQLAQHEEVLGQDQEGLRGLRNALVGDHRHHECHDADDFDQAIAATRESRDVLLASLGIQSAIQGYMEQSVAHLKTLVGLVTPTGSFQTVPGQVRPNLTHRADPGACRGN